MIVTFVAEYVAENHTAAIEQGTKLWREYLNDATAELPWDASLRFEIEVETITERNAAGETIQVTQHADYGSVHLSVKRTITPGEE